MDNTKNREFVRTLHSMIADFLRDNPDIDRSYYQEIWDWLEKKEESEDERIREWLVDYFKKVGKSWIHRDISPEQVLAYLEKQKEQKPVNWTELNWKDINRLEDFINTVHNEYPNGIGQESFGREVLEKFFEYKEYEYPAEKEQKSAEWSEEDEKMRNRIIGHLSGLIYRNPLYGEDANECIAWLESLLSRPKPSDNWKPTKEQLDALLEAAREKEIDREDGNVLYQLYDQLKKL